MTIFKYSFSVLCMLHLIHILVNISENNNRSWNQFIQFQNHDSVPYVQFHEISRDNVQFHQISHDKVQYVQFHEISHDMTTYSTCNSMEYHMTRNSTYNSMQFHMTTYSKYKSMKYDMTTYSTYMYYQYFFKSQNTLHFLLVLDFGKCLHVHMCISDKWVDGDIWSTNDDCFGNTDEEKAFWKI